MQWIQGWILLLAAVLLDYARPHPIFVGSIRKAGLKSFVGHPLRPGLRLGLRGGGPKASSANRSYPPGSLPDWAEEIVKYRNSTPFSERATEARNFVWDSTTTSSSDDGAAPDVGLRWEGVDKGFVKRDPNMEDDNDKEEHMDPGPFPDGRTRREFNKMLRDIDPEGYDPRILEQGGKIKTMWNPDSPCYTNVTLRKAIPMALHPDIVHPNMSDPGFFLREAAKLGEEYEIERQVLAGAPIDCTDPLFSDWTPLHYAAWNGHAAACEMLLRLGAKPFPLDHADWTPWECALILEHEDVMFTLKENGASMPYQETMLPRNATPHIVDENSGFLCSNEFFNPNFTQSLLYKFWSHRWIEKEDSAEHPPGGGLQTTSMKYPEPPVVSEWIGDYTACSEEYSRQEAARAAAASAQEPETENAKFSAVPDQAKDAVKEDTWVPDRDEQDRVMLNCPFADKDKCKAAGGRWSNDQKRWFAPPGADLAAFRAWWPPKPVGWMPQDVCEDPGGDEPMSSDDGESESIPEECVEGDEWRLNWRNQELRCLTKEPLLCDENDADDALGNGPSPETVNFDNLLSDERYYTSPGQLWHEKFEWWRTTENGKRWEKDYDESLANFNITHELQKYDVISESDWESMERRQKEACDEDDAMVENSGTHGGSYSISDNVWSSFGAGGNEFEEELRQELERQGQLEGVSDQVGEQDSTSAES